MTERRAATRATAGAASVLALAVALIYAPTLRHEFVGYDDDTYVYANPQVLGGLSLEGVRWAFVTSRAANWHPLTWLSHMLDVELFGTGPAGHHATSVVLHAVNAVLLLLALHRLSGAFAPSAFAAALFALHPLRVESVAWVAERKDVLSGLFWMLALLAYAGYARRPSASRYALLLAAAAAGLLAKPMLVTLPFVLLLLDYWPLGRIRRARPVRAHVAIVLEKLPLFALAAASSIVTALVQRRAGAVGSLDALPLGARLANAAVAYTSYVRDTLLPTQLACFYPHPALVASPVSQAPAALVAAAALVTLTVWIAVGSRTRPYLAVGWCWFLGTLVPVLGLVQVGMQARADRYTYVPSIGLAILVAWGAAEIAGGSRARRRALVVGGAVVLAACSVLTARQVRTWKNNRTLFQHALDVTRNNYIAHNNLGTVCMQEGQWDQAGRHYEEAVRIKPNYPVAHYNLGLVLEHRREWAAAASHYALALRGQPGLAAAAAGVERVRARLRAKSL